MTRGAVDSVVRLGLRDRSLPVLQSPGRSGLRFGDGFAAEARSVALTSRRTGVIAAGNGVPSRWDGALPYERGLSVTRELAELRREPRIVDRTDPREKRSGSESLGIGRPNPGWLCDWTALSGASGGAAAVPSPNAPAAGWSAVSGSSDLSSPRRAWTRAGLPAQQPHSPAGRAGGWSGGGPAPPLGPAIPEISRLWRPARRR